MFQVGALVMPAFAALGFLRQSEKLLWTARSFDCFSGTSMLLATAANPKNFGSWKEKAYIVTSFVIYCVCVHVHVWIGIVKG